MGKVKEYFMEIQEREFDALMEENPDMSPEEAWDIVIGNKEPSWLDQ